MIALIVWSRNTTNGWWIWWWDFGLRQSAYWPADGDLEVTTANNTHHEFTDSEMILEDCDPEGWEDVESDTLEGNIYNDDSEDNFGDIYE